MIIAPITVLINLARRGKVANLPARQLAPDGSGKAPMDPGKPLLARPGTIIGILIPFAVVALVLVAATLSAMSEA
ncbi:hypothetical protein [Dactylosporangium darangshiense]|uniref:Uncharacterized protein n=1 Tax=Dactylosporangium darangshiense TaxID=579108 RepID=A0ABP8D9F6_9ACTN